MDNFKPHELSRRMGAEFRVHETVQVHRSVLFFGEGPFVLDELCRIDAYCVLTGSVHVGTRVHLGVGCYLNGSGRIDLEDYSGLSAGTRVFTTSDDYVEGWLAGPQFPLEMRNPKSGAVFVGKGAVVGSGSVLLPGLRIGEGASIGALSFVRQSVPDYEIWAGVPAHKIGERECTRLKAFMEQLDRLKS